MKKSNLFILVLSIVCIAGLFTFNLKLKNEYLKIDLSDPFKNYISIGHQSYSVLDITGSNGYPIKVVQKGTNDVKVLRSRLNHFKSELKNDTLFIKFTGSNIPNEQSRNSATPYGIIIENKELVTFISTKTHNRFFNFKNKDLQIVLKGNSFMEMSNCNLNRLQISLENSSYINFLNKNEIDSLDLKMTHNSIASLQNIEFNTINHSLKDSVAIVLSKDAFNRVLK